MEFWKTKKKKKKILLFIISSIQLDFPVDFPEIVNAVKPHVNNTNAALVDTSSGKSLFFFETFFVKIFVLKFFFFFRFFSFFL